LLDSTSELVDGNNKFVNAVPILSGFLAPLQSALELVIKLWGVECRACNHRKGPRTPEQARMPLLYAPYVPSIWEDFILRNRRILVDQMEFLRMHVPRGSRLAAHKDHAIEFENFDKT